MTRWAITGREQPQQNNPLFDYLVGSGNERLRNGQTEIFRGFEIDRQQDSGGLFYWQVSRLSPIQNPSDEIS